MYFRPRLYDGRLAPVAWQIRLFFLNICWPLADDATWIRRRVDNFMIVAGFILLSLCNVAECSYVTYHMNDIGLMLDGLATYLILIEVHCRIFSMALRKQAFKEFLKEFYTKIYIESDYNNKMYRKIQRSLLPTVLYSYSYIGTLMSYFAFPVVGLFANRRLLPFKMLIPYDYTQVPLYIPTLFVNLWLGVVVVSYVVGESNILATIILHLNGRYMLLQEDCRQLHASLLHSCHSDRILWKFRQSMVRIIQRNKELNEFAAKLQAQYSFRIFMMMGMSSVLLCVLGFKAVTLGMTTHNISYICWIAAKILELVVFGELGSQLIFSTHAMSSMYYLSNWEDVILQSSNSVENTQVMKLIALAIEVNQKPIYVTGFNFFSVSLITVVSILQCAGSYFTCLYAFRYSWKFQLCKI